MKYGDKDGYNEIYDEKGDLILHPNEKILVTEENVVPSLKSTWRYYGGDYLLEPSKGNMILTNERLVFINIPERMFAIGDTEESRAMNAPTASTFDLGNMSSGTSVREFFEIPNIEIMGSEMKEGAVSVGEMVNVYVLSSGNQYHLSTVLSSESDLLERLLNKKVDNLDELVNNLKDFFRKTDWMFKEEEKKSYGSFIEKQKAAVSGESIEPDTKAADTEKSEEREPPPSEVVTRPAPSLPRRRVPVSVEVGRKSKDYFESLYSKGLIKEEIFNKLMVQFGALSPELKVQPPSANAEALNSQPMEVPPSPEQPPQPEVEVPPQDDTGRDEDLLNMLDSTLSDLGGDQSESGEGSAESEPQTENIDLPAEEAPAADDQAEKEEEKTGEEEKDPEQKGPDEKGPERKEDTPEAEKKKPVRAKKVHRRKK